MVYENWSHKQYQLRKNALNKFKEIIRDKYNQLVQSEDIFTVDDVKDLPHNSGVYLIFDGDNLVYIGRSKNIKTRLSNHSIYKRGNSIQCWLLPEDLLRPYEWAMIAIFKPNQKQYYLDTNFLNNFDIEEITGIKYKRIKLEFRETCG